MSAVRPVVALVAEGPGATRDLRPLVRALAAHVEVRSAGRATDPAAYLVAGAAARDRAPEGAPVAVAAEGRLAIRHGDAADVVDLVTGPSVDTTAWPPIAPHVRRRWRRRLGLPDDLVVDTGTLDPDDVPTALAVAAAAVLGADHLPLALALGCPSVVAADVAAAMGAVDRVHVVVGARDDAEALAGDHHQAALLSRQGRHLALVGLDPARAAGALLRAWRLGPSGPLARLDARLAELGTAPAAPIRRRVADALAALGPPTNAPTALPGGP